MARSRNIKPGFFKNEELAELDPFDRLLFAGLWMLCDREGRLEDRPKRVKMELFPMDSYDVNQGLDNLVNAGFLKRYEIEQYKVISVVSFLEHQKPHGTEKDSKLPDINGYLTVNERSGNGYITGNSKKVSVIKQTHSEKITVKEQLDNSAETVSSQSINALNPESLNPESSKNTKHHSRDEFENFWKNIREIYKATGCNPGTKSEAETEFLKLKPDEGEIKRWLGAAKAQSVWIEKKRSDGEFAESFKHVCRWLKHGGFDVVYESQSELEPDPFAGAV
jgi:hypothetical protein